VPLKLGIHIGPQDLSIDELQRLWQRADESGFHWVSVWDHFYSNPLKDRRNPCFEGVSAMTALAAATRNVRVGCLVFCALFRNPGLLAKAAASIDHISNGRAEIGVGAGWLEEEFREFGYGFPPLGQRLDQLEEALTILRSLWWEDETNFHGKYYTFDRAVCAPKPLNPKMRLWVGGRGKQRTPDLAARFADGFNMPYLSPDCVADRLCHLERACATHQRDIAEIESSVNVGFYMGDNAAPPPEPMASGALCGSSQAVIDRIGLYCRAGVNGLNLAIRPPIDWDALETFIAEVLPEFHEPRP